MPQQRRPVIPCRRVPQPTAAAVGCGRAARGHRQGLVLLVVVCARNAVVLLVSVVHVALRADLADEGCGVAAARVFKLLPGKAVR